MIGLAFIILVVVGFALWWTATWPNPWKNAEFAARGCFFLASLLWAFGLAAHR